MKKILVSVLILCFCLILARTSLAKDSSLEDQNKSLDYVTKSSPQEKIPSKIGQVSFRITTEARVLRSKDTGKILKVEDFGSPYASISGFQSEFQHGGFSIDRTSPKSARFSARGQFIISKPSFLVGGDIISYPMDFKVKTEPLTIISYISW